MALNKDSNQAGFEVCKSGLTLSWRNLSRNTWFWVAVSGSQTTIFSMTSPPTVAAGSSCLTHASKSAATIGWPGWPCT